MIIVRKKYILTDKVQNYKYKQNTLFFTQNSDEIMIE
jgi:hypothetical protein